MRRLFAIPLLVLAGCGLARAGALRDPGLRAEVGQRLLATLDHQRHYFDNAPHQRRLFADRLRLIADSTSDATSYYRALSSALATLDEGHTGLVASHAVPFGQTIPPVAILEIDGHPVVAGVAPGVESGGLRAGDLILEVDGHPAPQALERQLRFTSGSTEHGRRARAYSNLLAGPTHVPALARVRGNDGRERYCFPLRFLLDDAGVDRFRFGFVSRTTRVMRLTPATVHIGLPDFHPDRLRELESILLMLGSFPIVILDLRGNPGGRIHTLQKIAGLFLGEPAELLQLREEGGVEPLLAKPGKVHCRSVLRILVDERTGSAAELLAAALRDTGRARLYGRRTAGSARSRRSALLPGGVVFHYAGRTEFRRLDGRAIEGAGVQPDVVFSPAREQLAAGEYGDPLRDPAVRFATGRN